MSTLRHRFTGSIASIFAVRSRNSLRSVPAHLLADCGFEGAANGRAMNQEIDRMTLTLSSLR